MTDWYRNTDWTDEIAEDFFTRLKRTRSQRDEYIVLQAISLIENAPEVSLELIDLYFETRTDEFNDGRAAMVRAQAQQALDDPMGMIESYADALSTTDGGALMTVSPIEFAYHVVASRETQVYWEAWSRIESLLFADLPGSFERYAYHAARALLLDWRGLSDAAFNDATTALEAVADLGDLAQDALDAADKQVIWRLRQIVRR